MSFSKKRARVRKNTRTRALSLTRNHATPLERWTKNSRESLSLSLFLFRARRSFEREMINPRKQRDTKKCGAQEKSPHENTILSSSFQKRERDTFSAQTTTRTYPLERMCLCTSSVAPCVKSTYEPCFFIFSHRG